MNLITKLKISQFTLSVTLGST